MNITSIPLSESLLPAGLIALAPLSFLAFVLVPDCFANRHGKRFAMLCAGVGVGVLGLAILAMALRFAIGPVIFELARIGPLSGDVYFDTLSAVMMLLVAFLGAVVLRYSVNYLAGDPGQGCFTKWLAVTIGSVLTLSIAGNLLLFTAAWVATSLSLHRLLVFQSDRPAAVLAAWKKFLFSRLGDACLIGALIMTWQCFGTWKFSAIFEGTQALRDSGGPLSHCLGWTNALLVAGALLKSAQFPFHSWLPDTMETPTPVSALMHAGIINAGGFLIVRLSPIIVSSPAALNILALVGTFTALFASLIMLTQTSVKRSLAYSTVAQMGFMMLQCGLGAFSLAILHIVAHSLYKAHAFLSSGSIVRMTQSAWMPSERPAAHPVVLIGTLGSAFLLTWGGGRMFGLGIASERGEILLGSVFMMALAFLLWNLWASSPRAALFGWGWLIGGGAALAFFGLHAGFEKLLKSSIAPYAPQRSLLEYGVMAFIALLFTAMLVLQSLLPSWSGTRFGGKLYVHASQGFYLGAVANRVTLALMRKIAA